MISSLEIRPLTLADAGLFAEATEILNRTQGRDLFSQNYLADLVVDSKARIFAAFIDGRLMGLGVAQIISDFNYYLPFDENICLELEGKSVGSFSTMAMHEDAQGKGIGQQISQLRLAWLHEQGCEVILGNSWVSGLRHTSDRVFEKMGFRKIKLVENFFVESSLKQPFDCPGCRVHPCSCAAILYRLG